jgi:Pyridoxamine 5'-phosphate oxidase
VEVIDPDVAALLESGAVTFIGTVDGHGNPAAAHAFGIRVLDGGLRMRVTLNAEETAVLENLRETGVAAIGATDVPTLRSVQVKGRAAPVEPLTVDDRLRFDRYRAELFRAINEVDGTPFELLGRLVPRELLAVVVTAEEIYDQTPGPQAGASLVPGAS